MTKLDKDQVVAEFTAAYKAAFGKAPQLEQKPGWFSVDGGKNLRLAELAELGASYSADKGAAQSAAKSTAKAKPAAEKKAAPAKAAAKPAKKPAKKAAAKPAKAAKTKSGNGQSAADIWAAQLDDKQRQPRGYR
ncbi:hypothetical protein [Rheinheimera sp. EpRS3]|uniref:hypothetical protein n=1 Tax=Rheinheimera sp. EpRS3 TaxID=1712383 RepID=UPI000748AE9B|nr:hypothetical protein [Rheinheimera sp. EpRS3]KUM55138.1 hypothetical protein AR688_18025 [Rheinheimera sp. EpRS3]